MIISTDALQRLLDFSTEEIKAPEPTNQQLKLDL